MAVRRIQEALRQTSSSRINICYGSAIDDVFFDDRYEEINIETAIWQELNQLGYERILYFSPHQGLYFLDEESQTGCMPSHVSLNSHAESDYMEKMSLLSGGPLQDRMLIKRQKMGDSSSPFGGMGDVHAIRMMDAIMKEDGGLKTAIIFMQAETLLRYNDDVRSLSGIIGEWYRLPAGNQNTCLFLFSADYYDDLCEIVEHSSIPELRNSVMRRDLKAGNGGGLVNIGDPDKTELLLLLDYLVDTINLMIPPDEYNELAGLMAVEGGKMRYWINRLRSTKELSLEEARSLGWFSVYTCHKNARDRLNELIGLSEVKQRVFELEAWYHLEKARSESGERLNPQLPLMHMIFSGNPGTGKTTVARLLGEIFRDIGLLRRGHLVEVKAGDLIADHVGGTAIKTNRAIDNALDGILFIDEAYTLCESERGGFGLEAIDTMLTRMEDERSKFLIIAAGYPQRMSEFIHSNPGLSRRFPEENRIDFPDYSPKELWQILEEMLVERELPFHEKEISFLKDVINGLYHGKDEHFGNAGEMRNLVNGLDRRRAARIMAHQLELDSILVEDDLPDIYRSLIDSQTVDLEDVLGELNQLVGLNSVKISMRREMQTIKLEQARDINRKKLNSFVFYGNPGTGKTTVARLIGKIYAAMGLLRKGHCIEVSRVDLVAGYTGQTALKTMKKIKEAVGGVLFIDEAYTLVRGNNGDFGREVIDVLVKAMDDYKDKIVFILAGYPEEMKSFMAVNPGLRSRFGQVLQFGDYSVEELMKVFMHQVVLEGYSITSDAEKAVRLLIDSPAFNAQEHFGNARSVLNLFEFMKSLLAERVFREQGEETWKNGMGKLDHELVSTFQIEDVVLPESMEASSPFEIDRFGVEEFLNQVDLGRNLGTVLPPDLVSHNNNIEGM